MACTRKTKTLVSTCVILSGMTNIVCLLYVGWVTNYIANIYIKVPMPVPERKLEGDKRGDTVRIMERLDRLENVVNQHIQGKAFSHRLETFNAWLPFMLQPLDNEIKDCNYLKYSAQKCRVSLGSMNRERETGSARSFLQMGNCAFCAWSAKIYAIKNSFCAEI